MFDSWSPAQITFLAAVVAAVVGATGAFTAAMINAIAARRLAYDSARRAYRLEIITPYLENLDARIVVYHELITEGAELVRRLNKSQDLLTTPSDGSSPLETPKRAEYVEQARGIQDEMARKFTSITERTNTAVRMLYKTGVWVFLRSDRRVFDSAMEWMHAEEKMARTVVSSEVFTADPDKLAELDRCARAAQEKAIALRRVIEDVVFQQYGWLRRSLYFLKSTLKRGVKAVRKRLPGATAIRIEADSTQFTPPHTK
jgi:hypothetical protein